MADRRQQPSFAGRRILIAEDELLLALELQKTLGEWGCIVLGPVPSTSRALALLETEVPDAVVLDLNLKDELATPVADVLAARGIPFVLLTGYGAMLINDAVLRAAPHVNKPLEREMLGAALSAALDLDGSDG